MACTEGESRVGKWATRARRNEGVMGAARGKGVAGIEGQKTGQENRGLKDSLGWEGIGRQSSLSAGTGDEGGRKTEEVKEGGEGSAREKVGKD